MKDELKNGKVDWRTFMLILGIGTTILGILWNAIIKVQVDVTDIKVDAKETRTMLNALIDNINRGNITLKNNVR